MGFDTGAGLVYNKRFLTVTSPSGFSSKSLSAYKPLWKEAKEFQKLVR